MRMRRKPNLEPRMEAVKDYVIVRLNPIILSKPEQERYNYIDIEKEFGNNNPLVLEIGSGKAKFTVEMAKRYPNVNFIGVEMSANIIVMAAETAKRENLKNVKFFNTVAELLPYLIKENSVKDIYLNFSCPYPKKQYENHRLTYYRFLDIYKKLMVKGARIYLKTDNVNFFDYSLESLKNNGFTLEKVTRDLYSEEYAVDNIPTEYEEKFVKTGAKILRLEAFIKE